MNYWIIAGTIKGCQRLLWEAVNKLLFWELHRAYPWKASWKDCFAAATGDEGKPSDSEPCAGSAGLFWTLSSFNGVPCVWRGWAGSGAWAAKPGASCSCSQALPSESCGWALKAPLCSCTDPFCLETVPRCTGLAQGLLCKATRGG